MILQTTEWVKGGEETAAGGRALAAWNVSTGLYVAPGKGVDDNPVMTVMSHMSVWS